MSQKGNLPKSCFVPVVCTSEVKLQCLCCSRSKDMPPCQKIAAIHFVSSF